LGDLREKGRDQAQHSQSEVCSHRELRFIWSASSETYS
jgi:hypothetical protein